MKSIIITALLLVAISTAFAQTKVEPANPPAPVKTYPGVPNATPVTITITLPAAIWGDFATVAQVGPDAVDNSDQISAQRAKLFKLNYKAALDSLNAHWGAYMQADQKRWATDTLKQWSKMHPNK